MTRRIMGKASFATIQDMSGKIQFTLLGTICLKAFITANLRSGT